MDFGVCRGHWGQANAGKESNSEFVNIGRSAYLLNKDLRLTIIQSAAILSFSESNAICDLLIQR
jgi:hypothetical protein